MSRTFKDRPYYILKEDRKWQSRPYHQHMLHLREKIGEREEVVFPGGLSWNEKGNHYEKIPPRTVTYPIYKRWTETVPCTLDIPSYEKVRWSSAWQRDETVEELRARKHCWYNIVYYPNVRSRKDCKRLTNRAVRARVNQELRAAKYEDPEDVDFTGDELYYDHMRWYWD